MHQVELRLKANSPRHLPSERRALKDSGRLSAGSVSAFAVVQGPSAGPAAGRRLDGRCLDGRCLDGRCSGERGSGVLSTTFGVGVFLLLLLFSAHVLLNLWLRSSIDSVAFDAATAVATSGVGPEQLPQVQQQALTRAHEALGGYSAEVTLEFETSQPDEVALRVAAPGINLLPPLVASAAGLSGFEHRIVMPREEAPA